MFKDIVIMGGGLAGLALARQLKLTMPDSDICVLERRKHPADEACHKVGESSVEIGAHYFSVRLKLLPHLEQEQLYKLGLRFFFPSNNNQDIESRYEIGPSIFPKVPSYQLDRGRFENYLFDLNASTGITMLDECTINNILLSGHDTTTDNHTIYYTRYGKAHEINAAWVIDATGRFSLIKRKLKLEKPVKHCCHAAWFRLKTAINIDSWTNNSTWHQRIPGRNRFFSTNHFMGHGYWLWFIPLASGYTSVGLVIDDNCHNFSDIRKFDTLLLWLDKHEPFCAKKIREQQHTLSDFRFLKNYAHGCKQVFSANRWCITGEAGVFSDPFYSPGSDLISISNEYITQLILHSKMNNDINELAHTYNRLYLQLFEIIMLIYQDNYPQFGNAKVMTQKILWDSAIYLGVTCLLYFNQKLTDLNFMRQIASLMSLYNRLNYRVQQHFKSQAITNDNSFYDHGFLDLSQTGFFGADLNKELIKRYDSETEFITTLKKNIAFLEILAERILNDENIAPAISYLTSQLVV